MSQDQSLKMGIRVPYLDTPSFMALRYANEPDVLAVA